MRFSNVYGLGVKEIRGLLRDRTMIILVSCSFTVFIYSTAKGAPDTVRLATIAVVDEDRSPVSERIVSAFRPPYFTEPVLIGQTEMDRRLDEGSVTFALDIPPGFQRDLLSGANPTLQLNVDATRISQAFTGSGYVDAIVRGEIDEFLTRTRSREAPLIDLALRTRFNPSLDAVRFGALSRLVSIIGMLALVLPGAALIRERGHGTIEHLLVMPVTPLEIMLSKILSMSAAVLFAATFSLVVVIQGFLGVASEGSIPLFVAGVTLYLLATTSLGISLATVAGSMPRLGMLLMLVIIPFEMLSGTLAPRESTPDTIRYVMLAAPSTHFVMLGQAILFRGARLVDVWPQFAALAAIGLVLFAFSLRRFRQFLA